MFGDITIAKGNLIGYRYIDRRHVEGDHREAVEVEASDLKLSLFKENGSIQHVEFEIDQIYYLDYLQQRLNGYHGEVKIINNIFKCLLSTILEEELNSVRLELPDLSPEEKEKSSACKTIDEKIRRLERELSRLKNGVQKTV